MCQSDSDRPPSQGAPKESPFDSRRMRLDMSGLWYAAPVQHDRGAAPTPKAQRWLRASAAPAGPMPSVPSRPRAGAPLFARRRLEPIKNAGSDRASRRWPATAHGPPVWPKGRFRSHV